MTSSQGPSLCRHAAPSAAPPMPPYVPMPVQPFVPMFVPSTCGAVEILRRWNTLLENLRTGLNIGYYYEDTLMTEHATLGQGIEDR